MICPVAGYGNGWFLGDERRVSEAGAESFLQFCTTSASVSRGQRRDAQALVPSVSPFPPVSRVSRGYPAGVFSCCPTQADHRSSAVSKLFFRSPTKSAIR